MLNKNKYSTSGGDQSENNKRRIEGDICIKGQIKADLPPNFIEEYKTSNKQAEFREQRNEARENKRFLVEIVTLVFVAIVAAFGAVQTRQSIRSADAAKVAADTALLGLHVSERAYLAVSNVMPSIETESVNVLVSNTGHIPSQNTTFTYLQLAKTCTAAVPKCPSGSYNTVTGDSRVIPMQPITSAAPGVATVLLRGLEKSAFSSGEQYFTVTGDVNYNDGFDGTSRRFAPFCVNVIWLTGANAPSVIGCKDVTPKGPQHKDYN